MAFHKINVGAGLLIYLFQSSIKIETVVSTINNSRTNPAFDPTLIRYVLQVPQSALRGDQGWCLKVRFHRR